MSRSVPEVLALLAVLSFASACERSEARADKGRQDEAQLDAPGRWMLDPIREEALGVRELIPRLGLARDAVVADIGAGPGFLTLPIARAVPGGRVIATDIREDYLAVLARRATRAGVKNVVTRVVPADRSGLERAAVDLALMAEVDHALLDREAYFRALVPALKKGGRIALVNFNRYREADLLATKRAGLVVIDEWAPSGRFFLLVVAPSDGAERS